MVHMNTLTLWRDNEGTFSILESGKSNDHRHSGFINSDLNHQLLESHYVKKYTDFYFVKVLLLKTVKDLKTAPSLSYDPKKKNRITDPHIFKWSLKIKIPIKHLKWFFFFLLSYYFEIIAAANNMLDSSKLLNTTLPSWYVKHWVRGAQLCSTACKWTVYYYLILKKINNWALQQNLQHKNWV